MDWNESNHSDIAYPVGFFREQSPTHLHVACILNAADFMPVHVCTARSENLAPPGFIPMYIGDRWVNAEDLRYTWDFIARYLTPGGVYVDDNPMTGWSNTLPLQRLMLEYAAGHPGEPVRKLDGTQYLNANAGLGYLARDSLDNTPFREDVLVRGEPRMRPQRRGERELDEPSCIVYRILGLRLPFWDAQGVV